MAIVYITTNPCYGISTGGEMQKITVDHFWVLWALFHRGQFANEIEISAHAKTTLTNTRKLLLDMSDRNWCEGDEWVCVRKKNGVRVWMITGRIGNGGENTGGWLALQESAANPVMANQQAQAWREEALTGITPSGDRSKIINAAVGSTR
jgi:hypothetical protein